MPRNSCQIRPGALSGCQTSRIRVVLELRLSYLVRGTVVWVRLASRYSGSGPRTLKLLDVALWSCHVWRRSCERGSSSFVLKFWVG
jgi:hypothetical protein